MLNIIKDIEKYDYKTYLDNRIVIFNADIHDLLEDIKSESIDCIITDPPYGYLKHKLDTKFDNEKVFKYLYNILKNNSLLLFFGRGFDFYEWNVICKQLGFKFKEEIIWDKNNFTSPFLTLGRIHETLAVLEKGSKKLNKVKVDKAENDYNSGRHEKTINDIKRVVGGLKQIKNIEELQKFIDGGYNNTKSYSKHNLTYKSINNENRSAATYRVYTEGILLKSIIRVNREHYQYKHPTQKPLELLNNLMKLSTTDDDIVFDGFLGSGTTALSCIENNRRFIGCEIDKEYFKVACNRIEEKIRQPNLF